MNVSSSPRLYKKANIFLGLIEYEQNSLLGDSHFVDYILVHNRFDIERYLLNSKSRKGRGITQDFACTNGAVWEIFVIITASRKEINEIRITKQCESYC